ncbi:Nitrosoguanidine resistance protein SNG1, partial [Psilocybe cubensis]
MSSTSSTELTSPTVNQGSSSRLSQSLITPNATYDGSEAVSVFAVEARNENAFRNLIKPSVEGALDAIFKTIATQSAQQIANSTNLSELLTISPQTLVTPVSYRMTNLAPFDVPLATAVTFVGLIYQLILSFFIVMITNAAREGSGLDKTLPTRSLIILRLFSSFAGYLFISLFYCLLSVAFQLPLSRNGFLVFWMLNYCSMLSVGLALESLMTLLTVKGIPFFMITWIISNVAVCIFPIEVMPIIFRYGYAAPFYNVSRAMRTIVFGTKNIVGESFGILIVWIAIS